QPLLQRQRRVFTRQQRRVVCIGEQDLAAPSASQPAREGMEDDLPPGLRPAGDLQYVFPRHNGRSVIRFRSSHSLSLFFHRVTVSSCHRVILSPCHLVILSPCQPLPLPRRLRPLRESAPRVVTQSSPPPASAV